MPLVSFSHVIDPHFVTFSSSLYTTICNLNPNQNPNRNPTVITDPQVGPRDPQIVTVQIRPADPPRRSVPLGILSRASCNGQFPRTAWLTSFSAQPE